MGQSILRCPKKGSHTRVRFSGSPQHKPRENAHMSRSLLKLFFAKNQVSRRVPVLRLTNMSQKVEKYSKSQKSDKKHAKNQRLVVDPHYGQFWGPENYSRSVFHSPLPQSGEKGRLWKASTKNFFCIFQLACGP